MDLSLLQTSLDYQFKDIRLLKTALVHKSYLNERDRDPEIKENNERLEFLGDAVLELIVTDHIFIKLPNFAEGILTALRASLVNYKTVGQVGVNLGLEHLILLSKGEKEELGKARLTIVADCVEAILGAMYLDGGLEPCRQFIEKNILIFLEDIITNQTYKDYKTLLQEFGQKHTKITPHYRVLSSEGKDHEKVFRIGVWMESEKIGEGEGRSKQDAETEAAKEGLELLKKRYQNNE